MLRYVSEIEATISPPMRVAHGPGDATALDAAAEDWKGITERLGTDNQKKFWKEALSSYRSAGLLQ